MTFIDDFSKCGYLCLIHKKSQSLDMFKNLKVEVENQLSTRIKSVRFDCGDEYYDRYEGSSEQRPKPFIKFLAECGIISQYTMLGLSIMNDVTEKRNMTLKDMVMSMICHFTLLKSL